ncbi:MAG: RDD family protein [Desulfobacterales bacterium]|nr:RDD family protein [Deltaproteobacteria bacterium]NNL43756.1 RDD family protein [Desulfobacterales bacterium]
MDWYYADGKRKVGPISKEELRSLVKAKKIHSKTLVWRQGMKGWEELGKLTKKKESGAQPLHTHAATDQAVCSECGRTFANEEMISFENAKVCAECKPAFIQKIKEGVSVSGIMEYAGFWIRCGAIIIDGIILWAVQMVVYAIFGIITAAVMPSMSADSANSSFFIIGQLIITLFSFAISAGYDIWFVGRFAATPGKMACKIKIVTPDGGRVSYSRALGRHFAKWISSMILGIGFLMAAFDDEKRTLHDRICETRVIRK